MRYIYLESSDSLGQPRSQGTVPVIPLYPGWFVAPLPELMDSSFWHWAIDPRARRGCICSLSGTLAGRALILHDRPNDASSIRVYALLAGYLIVCSVVLSVKAFQVSLALNPVSFALLSHDR